MDFMLNVPLTAGGEPLSTTIASSGIMFVLGANGTGKSNLMHHFFVSHRNNAKRISAHRQTWFSSNSINISPEQRRQTVTNMNNNDVQPSARWQDPYHDQRPTIAIYDLLDAQNVRARAITDAVDADDFDLAKTLRKKDAPIKVINELLRISNLPVQISIRENEQVVATRTGSAPYSVAQLSDGERNALLIAADVLTTKPDTLILLDEPERHLHRSIISPLLTELFARRSDCAFIVSTHDVMLALDSPAARTLLIRGCTYQGDHVGAWDADLVPPGAEIDEDLKRDILGNRRKMLFVEGNESSLDKPLYTLIFPDVSVIPKASSRDVETTVKGLRGSADLHWLQAFGLVDNDRRTLEDINALRAVGVYALSVYSVEAVYYHPEVQKRVAMRASALTGANPENLILEAQAAALRAIRQHSQRLAERAAEKILRAEVFDAMPKREQVVAGEPIQINLDIPGAVTSELADLNRLADAGDTTSLIARYPVRETQALAWIVDALGFQSREQYEAAVMKLLLDDADTAAFVRTLFDNLPADLQV
jgi:ABC-type lipoprotein export system ATPase subunit